MKYTSDKKSVHGFILGFISMLLYLFFQKNLLPLFTSNSYVLDLVVMYFHAKLIFEIPVSKHSNSKQHQCSESVSVPDLSHIISAHALTCALAATISNHLSSPWNTRWAMYGGKQTHWRYPGKSVRLNYFLYILETQNKTGSIKNSKNDGVDLEILTLRIWNSPPPPQKKRKLKFIILGYIYIFLSKQCLTLFLPFQNATQGGHYNRWITLSVSFLLIPYLN